jgi:excisionase family DNA binding protein
MPEPSGPRPDRLMTPAEVAKVFRVDPKTVTRWANLGRLGSVKTPGGHRRYWESEVRQALGDKDIPAIAQPARQEQR